jgi:hypothetical protein
VNTAVSEKKRAANRANARASTGPRTPAGKRTVARNARRHGLNLPVMDDPALAPQVEALARDICGLGVDVQRQVSALHPAPHPALYSAVRAALHEKLHLARRIAEAEIDLMRVRRARHDLVARALADPDYRSSAGLGARIALLRRTGEMLHLGIPVPAELCDAILSRPQGPRKFALILADLAGELAAMDRYERRARSRRKFAIRAFDAAHSSHSPHVGEGRGGGSRSVAPHRISPGTPTPDPSPQGGGEKKVPRDKSYCRQPPHQVPVMEPTAPVHPAFWQNKATATNGDAGIAQRPAAPAGKQAPVAPGPYPDFAKRPYRALAKPPPDEMPFRQAADRLRDLLGLPAAGPPGGPSDSNWIKLRSVNDLIVSRR